MPSSSPPDSGNPYAPPSASSADPRRPTNVRWLVFVFGCGTSWLLYLHRYTFALIKPELEKELGLDTVELGMLDSAFSLCYTLFQFPLGMLTDFVGVHFMLTGMMLTWTSGLALHAWAPTFTVLAWARAMLGLGQSAVFASLNRMTRTWFPARVRTTVQGTLAVFFGRFGGLSANLLFATVLVGVFLWPWRSAVYLFAALGFVQAVAFFLLFRNSPRNHPWVNDAEADLIEEGASGSFSTAKPRPRMTVREMFRRMSPRSILNLFALNLQSILSTTADNIYSNWIPYFLSTVHLLDFKEMGIYSALPLLGGALGGMAGGWLNDFFIARTGNRRWSRTGVAMTGKGLAAVCLFTAFLFYDDPYAFCIVLFFVKLFGDWSLSTSWATVSDIGGRTTASVFAFNNSVAGVATIFAPLMYAYVAKSYGWHTVFVIAGCAYVLCSLSWLLVNCTIPILAEEEKP